MKYHKSLTHIKHWSASTYNPSTLREIRFSWVFSLTCVHLQLKLEFNLRSNKKLQHHDNVKANQFSSQNFLLHPLTQKETKFKIIVSFYIMQAKVK